MNDTLKVFECGQFGDMFITRDGRKAILVTHSKRGYVCSVQSHKGGLNSVQIPYNIDGRRERFVYEDDADIVGKWEEPTDTKLKKLEEIAIPSTPEEIKARYWRRFMHKARLCIKKVFAMRDSFADDEEMVEHFMKLMEE